MILLFLCVVFLGTIIIGFPLVWAVIVSTLLPMFAFSRTYPLEAVFLNFIGGIEPNIYIAIPLFILAGQLLNQGGMGLRIIRFVRTLVGFMPGGLGVCVVAAAMIFGGISGSAIADSAAVGSVMIPSMAQRGYRKPFAAALVAAAGTIGIIVPPSIPLLVYGFVGNVSVRELFIAGFVPGVVFAVCMMAVAIWEGKKTGCDTGGEHSSFKEIWSAFVGCAPALFMPVIILGGIFSGVTTPTEAAGLAVVYGLFVATVVYRDLSWKQVPKLITDAFIISAVVMTVIGATQALTWLITLEQMPVILLDWITHFSSSRWVFLLLINIALLILGHVLEPVPAILLTAPIFIPLAKVYGIDPVHLGLIVSCNLALGLFTPPIGATLFVSSRIAEVGVVAITRAMVPLFLVALFALFLITYVTFIPMGLVWYFR
jgi:C4-dicarboxylate transporter DctM subunit